MRYLFVKRSTIEIRHVEYSFLQFWLYRPMSSAINSLSEKVRVALVFKNALSRLTSKEGLKKQVFIWQNFCLQTYVRA